MQFNMQLCKKYKCNCPPLSPPKKHTQFYRRFPKDTLDCHMKHVWCPSPPQCNILRRFIYTRKQSSDNSHLITRADCVTCGTPLALL